MADRANTGAIPVPEPLPAVPVYRTDDGVISSVLIDRNDYRTYRTNGWHRDDPAFNVDPDLVKQAADNDGVIRMHSNLGGIPKDVTPDEVLWHQQNGWTVTS